MSKQEVDETTPLLDEEKGETCKNPLVKKAEEGEKKEGKSWKDSAKEKAKKVWKHVHVTPGAIMGEILQYLDLAPSFGEYIELAIRAGVVAMLFGALLLDSELTSRPWKRFADELMDLITPFTLIMFYFALGKTFGQTLYLIWGMLLGQGFATLAIWLMFGFFPGGYYGVGCPPHIWWAGTICGSLIVIFTLFVNMDGNIKIWVLANWIFFWMNFMDEDPNKHNQGFAIHHVEGSRAVMFRQAIFAALCGLIVSLVPYPITAKKKLTQTAQLIALDLCQVWEELTEAYWNNPDATVYEFDELVHRVDDLKDAQSGMADHLDQSWWECFGFGHLNSVRFCCQTLLDTLDHDLDRLPPVLKAITASQAQMSPESKSEHMRVGKMYLPHINALNEAACSLMDKSVEVACNGGANNDADKEALTKGIAVLREAIDALHDAVEAKRPNTGTTKKVLDLDYLDEYTFLFCVSHYGRSTSTFAQHLVDVQYESPTMLNRLGYLFVPWDLFDRSVIFSREHIRFVARNSLAIILAFAVGYSGFPIDFHAIANDFSFVVHTSNHTDTGASGAVGMAYASMLPRLSPGPAFILTLMVSKFVGSAISNTLNRVMGTILGIIFAMIIIGVVGRDWRLTTLALGIWTAWTVFMYYDCTTHAGTFLMMGYFGAGSMVRCVPAESCSFDDRKTRAIGLVIDGLFALLVMILVDHVMNAPSASKMASNKIVACWEELVNSTAHIFDTSNPDTRINDGVQRTELVSCVTLGGEAASEPRYWKTAWKEDLYKQVTNRNLSLRLYMVCMHYSAAKQGKNGGPKADFFNKICQDKEFKVIGEKMIDRMRVLSELIPIFDYEGQSRWPPLEDKSYHKNYMEETQALIDDFVKYVNHPEQAWLLEDKDDTGDHNDDSLEKDALCKISVLILLVQAMMEDMRKMQHDILRAR